MSEKRTDGLDAALAELARAERAARPEVSERLRARVLEDAAEVAAARPASAASASARPASGGRGWLGWLRGVDLWAGAAIAAAILCLVIGLGVGYEAGDRVLAEAGFEDTQLAQAADEDATLLLAEDVL